MKPEFLILTFPRSGSTSLYEILKLHPGICLPLNKETWYFSREYSKGEAWYEERFWHCKNNKTVLEINTEAMLRDQYLNRINETLPDAKIVVLLRDPLQRTVSHFYHSIQMGHETRSIEKALRGTEKKDITYKFGYLTFSLRYKSSITTILNLYNRQKVKFILFEELIREPAKVLQELQSFLKVQQKELSLLRENVTENYRNKILRSLTNFPLRCFKKITNTEMLNTIIPVGQKRNTRKVRSRIIRLLKRFSGMGSRSLIKPPLSEELKSHLVDRFNKELGGIEELTGLPISKYWTWFQSTNK